MRVPLAVLSAALLLVGCQTGTLPNPNDPKQAGMLAPDVLRKNMRVASNMLNERLLRREIDDAQYKDLIKRAANKYLEGVKVENTTPEKAWEYVEVLRAAERWADAEAFARIAVQWAKDNKNEVRRVNDTLRLAQAEAAQGRISQGFQTTRETFNAGDHDTAPILMATLYEFTPLVEGKGHDTELARLIEDAIACHNRMIVNPNEDAGQAFLFAKRRHLHLAWKKIVELYTHDGKTEEAVAAAKRGNAMMDGYARV